MGKTFDELTITDDTAKQCTSVYISYLRDLRCAKTSP